MARKTVVVLKDDIDGGEAIESISFSVRGRGYEIDLSEKNAKAFDMSLAKWIAAARKTGRSRATRGRASGSGDAPAIRVWAAENGIKVSERGRIPQDIVAQYQAAK